MTTIIWFSPLSTGCPDLFWKLSRWPDPQSRPSVKMFETSWCLLPLTNHLKDTESSKDGHSMYSHIARSAAPSSVDTKDSVTDVSENSVAFAIWDHWKVANLEKRKNDTKQKNLLQFWRNASRGITGLPPACYAHLLEYKLVQDFLIYDLQGKAFRVGCKWFWAAFVRIWAAYLIVFTMSPGATTSPGFGRQTEE